MTEPEYRRYALYHVPAGSAWADWATGWLGWDAVRGANASHPDISALVRDGSSGERPLDIAGITEKPRRYGLHATLKAPFRPAEGFDQAALIDACQALAEDLEPTEIGRPEIADMGGFLALRPAGGSTMGRAAVTERAGKSRAAEDNRLGASGIAGFAAHCVRTVDGFRARPLPGEKDRWANVSLSASQRENIANWGYPYVLGDFRFHITLTGNVAGETLAAARSALETCLAPLLPDTLAIADFSLVGEDAQGRFHVLRVFPVGAKASRPARGRSRNGAAPVCPL